MRLRASASMVLPAAQRLSTKPGPYPHAELLQLLDQLAERHKLKSVALCLTWTLGLMWDSSSS